MDDTVKLIIEIPKSRYQEYKDLYAKVVCDNVECDDEIFYIANGTPLDDLKADIKTYSIIKQNPIANRKFKADSIEVWKAVTIEKEHIKELLDKIETEIKETRKRRNVGVMECLDIIDRYKAESEE